MYLFDMNDKLLTSLYIHEQANKVNYFPNLTCS